MISIQSGFEQRFKNVCKKVGGVRSPKIHQVCFFITLPIATFGTVISINTAQAQEVSADGTLSTTVTKSADGLNFTINDGNKVGGNLFHSFKEFSVPTNGSAIFNNGDVQNIIGRVTGGLRSDINGLIKAQGSANLFLINPAGILFGPNARLSIGGSFFGSTANSLLFDGGVEFSATDLQAPPLLTVNIPNGLKFRDNPANITNQSVAADINNNPGFGLQVPSGKTLALVGGDINFNSGKIVAPGAKVELGGLKAAGTVGLNNDGSLSFPEGVLRGDVFLTNEGFVDVSAGGGGSIAVNAGNLELSGESFLRAGIGRNLGDANTQAGNIEVNAQDAVRLKEGSVIENIVFRSATGQAGNIIINTGSLFLASGALLDSSLFGTGKAGSVIINAPAGTVSLEGDGTNGYSTTIYSTVVGPVGNGKGGDITINTGKLFVSAGARILARNEGGTGNAGSITITATDTVSLAGVDGNGEATVGTDVAFGGEGNGNNLNINAPSVVIKDQAIVAASIINGKGQNGGFAQAGNVNITATDKVTVNNSSVFSEVGYTSKGNGGNINISAPSVSLENGGALITQIRGGIFTDGINEFIFTGEGKAGNINIITGSLSVNNASLISSSTNGKGDAGNLFIKADNLVEVLGTGEPDQDSTIGANVFSLATGNAGNLTINTKKLVIRSSQVASTTFGKGNAGTLTINASESVDISGKVFSINRETGQIIRNPAGLFAQVNTEGEGNGGNLTIKTPRLSVGDGGKIQVAVFGKGNAGNLLIRASDIDIYDTPGKADFFQGGIFAGFQVDEDQTTVPPKGDFGGTVTIETDRLRVRDGGTVTVFTQGDGNAGTLRITAKDFIDVSGEAVGTTTNRIFTSTISGEATADSTGTGGTVILNTNKLIVRDRGRVTVSSENTKPAGNLEITARKVNLTNGSLTASSKSGDGGNISLNVRDSLFMRRNSEISTSAGASGNGGNIFINNLPNYRGFVIAIPSQNNDIFANAFDGQGGKITINSPGVFGLVVRRREDLVRLLNTTDPVKLTPRNLPTSDITAFSQNNPSLPDAVQVNSETDLSQKLIELPETVQDPTQQIAQNPCQQGAKNEFVVTGRGGLPPSPNEILNSDNTRIDLVQPVAMRSGGVREGGSGGSKKNASVSKPIVPAQGWVLNDKGEVLLTAYNPTSNESQRSWGASAVCPAR
jgi:filamentous hemagglutinin family protein